MRAFIFLNTQENLLKKMLNQNKEEEETYKNWAEKPKNHPKKDHHQEHNNRYDSP